MNWSGLASMGEESILSRGKDLCKVPSCGSWSIGHLKGDWKEASVAAAPGVREQCGGV